MARLRAARHRDLGAGALDGRHVDRAAERRGGERDRHPTIDVGAVALKNRVLRNADEDVEVACRRAVQADLALAGKADTGAVLDPGRDGNRQRLLAPYPALTAARAARLFDDGAGTLAGRAGALYGEEALLGTHSAMTLAGAAAGRAGTRLGAAAVARLALGEGVDADRRL